MAPPSGMVPPGPPPMQATSPNQPLMPFQQPGGQHAGAFQGHPPGAMPGQHPGAISGQQPGTIPGHPGPMQGQQQANFPLQPGIAHQAMQQQDQIQALQQAAMQQGVMHPAMQQGSLQQGAMHPSFQQQGSMQAIQQNTMHPSMHQGTPSMHQGTPLHPSLQQQASMQGNMQALQQGGLPQDPAILGGMASHHTMSPNVAAAYMEQQQAAHMNMYLPPDPAATPPPSAQTFLPYHAAAGLQPAGNQAGRQLAGNQAGMQGANTGMPGSAYIGPGNSSQYIQQQYKVGMFFLTRICKIFKPNREILRWLG